MKQVMNLTGITVTVPVEIAVHRILKDTSGLMAALDESGTLSLEFDIKMDDAIKAIKEVYGEVYKCPRYFARREGAFQSGSFLVVAIDEDNIFRLQEDKTRESVAMTLTDCEQYVHTGAWCEIPIHIARRLGVLE